jgi:cell division protein FtsQ
MKLHKYLGFFVVSFLLLGLIVVSQWRNDQREIERLEVIFANDTHNFLNVEMVDKLLIQNEPLSHIGVKDTLALSSIEAELEAYDVILNVEVYSSPSRVLTVSIQERVPLVRIAGEEAYYIDYEAVKIPLSDHFTPHVPLFFGTLSKEQTEQLVRFMQNVNKDDFLKREIVQIEAEGTDFSFKIRSHDFVVEWGSMNGFNEKFKS